MTLIVRQKGSRRWKLPAEFPLTDSRGVFVLKDRRQLPDRRKASDEPDDLMVMLAEMTDDLSA